MAYSSPEYASPMLSSSEDSTPEVMDNEIITVNGKAYCQMSPINSNFVERCLFLGPMGAGKTNKLITLADKMVYSRIPIKNGAFESCQWQTTADQCFLFISYAATVTLTDKPGMGILKGHNGRTIEVISTLKLAPILEYHRFFEVSTIFIDEAHFFSDLDLFMEACRTCYKTVYAACVNKDIYQKPFPNIVAAWGNFTSFTSFNSRCRECPGQNATTTLLKSQFDSITTSIPLLESSTDDPTESRETHLEVGGFKTYTVVCDVCFNNYQRCLKTRRRVEESD